MKISKIGIFSQVLFQETINIVNDLLAVDGNSKISFFMNPELYDFLALTNQNNNLRRFQKVALEDMSVDCIIPIGGDGTILRVARARPNIPILSINKGRRGVMAEIEPKVVIEEFNRCLRQVLLSI